MGIVGLRLPYPAHYQSAQPSVFSIPDHHDPEAGRHVLFDASGTRRLGCKANEFWHMDLLMALHHRRARDSTVPFQEPGNPSTIHGTTFTSNLAMNVLM